jgi:hypothetical protein
MSTLFRNLLNLALLLAIASSLSGCALSQGVHRTVKGRYKIIKDNTPAGWHMGPEPQPGYAPLYFITIPVDIATFPVQVPFWFCIGMYYDGNM